MSELTVVNLGHINLRGNVADERFVDGVSAALGQPLPAEANTLTQADHRIYWLGPDEWQVVAAPDAVDHLTTKLNNELVGQHVAVNAVSGGQSVFHLSGEDVPEHLAKGCTLDLDPSVFREGMCAQSGLAKANMLLGYIDAAPVYEIIVRRSFSGYVLRWLSQNWNCRGGLDSC